MNSHGKLRFSPRPSRAAWVSFVVAALAAICLRSLPASFAAGATDVSSLPLLQKSNLSYVGAFRLPDATSAQHTFEYGGTALTYWPAHDSLLVVGHDWYQEVGEVGIPTPGVGGSVSDLPRATLRQPLTDILQGKRLTIDGDTTNGVKIGGILPFGDRLVVTAWSYYDALAPQQTRSHFVTGQNFGSLSPADVSGPFQVGTGYSPSTIAGFVSGYMSLIPPDWQSALGGTALTGQGGYVSVLGRTSSGPSANVFNPSDLGIATPAPAAKVMGYPLDHPTLGQYGVNGGLYNGTQGFRGMVFPDGTRSVLFIGWGGSTFCYGAGTADPALNMQPVPGYTDVHYCYDPTPNGVGGKGTHSYPTTPIVFAYDANDFVAVKNGSKQPWEIVPYATWTFTLPFQSRLVNGIETGSFEIVGAAYDPATKRLFLSAASSDGAAPIIHVFTVNGASDAVKRLCF